MSKASTNLGENLIYTITPRNCYLVYIVTYNVKLVTTSWIHSMQPNWSYCIEVYFPFQKYYWTTPFTDKRGVRTGTWSSVFLTQWQDHEIAKKEQQKMSSLAIGIWKMFTVHFYV